MVERHVPQRSVLVLAATDEGSPGVVAQPDPAESFDAFFASALPGLVAYGFVLTADRAAAEDLAAEALVRTWERWDRISGFDNPGAWARRVVHNLAMSRWRVRRRLVFGSHPVDTTVDPPRTTEYIAVAQALRCLPRKQQVALVLHDGLGYSGAEVAAEFGVPVGTVKSWLHRGRRELATRLGDQEVKP